MSKLQCGAKDEISLADILAQKKLEKRKKRRFRKSKPTHVEEVMSLVDLQMQALQQFMGNRINKDQAAKEKGKSSNISTVDSCERKRYGDERRPCEVYYKMEQKKDKLKEENIYQDRSDRKDFKRRPRSRSKEFHREPKRYKIFCSKEPAFDRRKRSRSRSKKRVQRSKSRSKDIRKRSRSRSKDRRKRSRSRSKDRRKRSRSRSKEISKSRRKHTRSRSNERFSKQSNKRDYDSYYDKNYEKNRHNKRQSNSPETGILKKHNQKETAKYAYYDDAYTASHQSKKRQHCPSRDKDNYKHLPVEKSSYHKKKKRERDRN